MIVLYHFVALTSKHRTILPLRHLDQVKQNNSEVNKVESIIIYILLCITLIVQFLITLTFSNDIVLELNILQI